MIYSKYYHVPPDNRRPILFPRSSTVYFRWTRITITAELHPTDIIFHLPEDRPKIIRFENNLTWSNVCVDILQYPGEQSVAEVWCKLEMPGCDSKPRPVHSPISSRLFRRAGIAMKVSSSQQPTAYVIYSRRTMQRREISWYIYRLLLHAPASDMEPSQREPLDTHGSGYPWTPTAAGTPWTPTAAGTHCDSEQLLQGPSAASSLLLRGRKAIRWLFSLGNGRRQTCLSNSFGQMFPIVQLARWRISVILDQCSLDGGLVL